MCQPMGWPAKQKTVMERLWLMSSYFEPFVSYKCLKHCVLDNVSGFSFKHGVFCVHAIFPSYLISYKGCCGHLFPVHVSFRCCISACLSPPSFF